jgi:glycerophosphoryl diester phosphodiesterase/lysophospholipase L1-like esterase
MILRRHLFLTAVVFFLAAGHIRSAPEIKPNQELTRPVAMSPAVAGQSGRESGSSTPSPDEPAPRTDQNSRIAHEQLLEKARKGGIDLYFVGDSITRRWGASDSQYSHFLANWRRNFFGWNAGNFAWGGDTTQNILWRLKNGELDGVNPKVIVILAGTNNVGKMNPRGSDDPRVSEITRGIKAIVDTCRQKAVNATIVLMGILPRNDNIAVMPIINQINGNIARFADGRKIRYLNINDKLADKNGKFFDGMAPDGLHLDVKGYQVWADALKPILTELLGPPAKVDHAPPPTGDPSAGNRPPTTSNAVRPRPLLVAHRGASAYAPEHTLAAYRLAIEQAADFVEQDLQLTRDGVLICLHDPDLSRTTNVASVFPARATERDMDGDGKATRGWYTIDFTLAEIKRLDAGSWFNRANPFAARDSYAAERVPTLEEAIDVIGDRAGLYIEMKHYAAYMSLGRDMPAQLAALLKSKGFDRPEKRDRILIQCFYKTGLMRMRELAPHYSLVQLLPMEEQGREKGTSSVTPALAKEIAAYARGAGPSKQMIRSASDVAVFHEAGLVVHPYTFRGSTTAAARRPLNEVQPNGSSVRENIIADIRRFIEFGIDGGFTDYPDLWKR